MKLVLVPNPILTSGTKPVIEFDGNLLKLVKDMLKLLTKQVDPQGVGLAAPQVGSNLALFIIKPTVDAKIEAFINPKITEYGTLNLEHKTTTKNKKLKKNTPLEGCLSIPGIWGPVTRAKKVLLEYQTLDGVKHSKWFSGFKSVILQHEVDHLNGILFTQRSLEQKAQLYEEVEGKLRKLKY